VDSRIQVQLEGDGGGSTRQSRRQHWFVPYVPPGAISLVGATGPKSSKSISCRLHIELGIDADVNFSRCGFESSGCGFLCYLD